MSFASPLPWWGLVLLIAAAVLVASRAYARPVVPLSLVERVGLTTIRLLVFLVLILLLLRPVAIEPVAARDAVVAVLIDHSRSMRLADDRAERRLDRAVALVGNAIAPALGDEFQMEILAFGDQVLEADLDRLQPDARRSDLAAALDAVRERFEGRSLAGVILLSDGGDTSGQEPARAAERLPAPVFTLGIGSRLPRDREVLSIAAGEPALRDSVVEVAATIVSHGGGGAPIEVRLLEDGRPIQVRRVTPAADGSPAREVFLVAPKAAAGTLYTVELPADPAELVQENNTQSVLVRAPGRPRRILMIEGAPGYEHSFLKRVWQDDPGLEVDAVVRKGQNDRGDHTFYVQGSAARSSALAQGYPLTREALFVYDAVVLANVEGEFLRPEQLEATARFVAERGGGLLLLGALTYQNRVLADSPIADVLPLDWTDRGGGARPEAYTMALGEPNRLVLTADGEAHPMMQVGTTPVETRERWTQIPPLAGSVPLGGPRPGATILAMTGVGGGGVRPLVAIQRYGSGRAMMFAGEGSWRWQMRMPSDDRTYETFWRQVARWLTASAGEPVTLTTTGGQMLGDLVRLDVHARTTAYEPVVDATVETRVITPAGETRALTATLADAASGGYAAEFRADQPGVYRVEAVARAGGVELGAVRDAVLVGGADLELTDPRLNDEVLRRVAAASGGTSLDPGEIDQLAGLLRTRAREGAPPIVRDVWDNAWMFLLVVGLLAAEWTLRRQWGLR